MGTHANVGIVLILIGLVYWLKPNIFERWFWKNSSILQRTFGEGEEKKFIIKGFAICLTIVGFLVYCLSY